MTRSTSRADDSRMLLSFPDFPKKLSTRTGDSNVMDINPARHHTFSADFLDIVAALIPWQNSASLTGPIFAEDNPQHSYLKFNWIVNIHELIVNVFNVRLRFKCWLNQMENLRTFTNNLTRFRQICIRCPFESTILRLVNYGHYDAKQIRVTSSTPFPSDTKKN